MNSSNESKAAPDARIDGPATLRCGPFVHSAENVRHMRMVLLRCAVVLLGIGAVLFGWRALQVAGICVGACLAVQWVCWRLTRRPWLTRRVEACLTGVLLALTFPASVSWYVPLIAAVFAMILGAAPAGAARRRLWQGVLLGRLAVAVIVPGQFGLPPSSPMLVNGLSIMGDITQTTVTPEPGRPDVAPDAVNEPNPRFVLSGLTDPDHPVYSALLRGRGKAPSATPAVFDRLREPGDMVRGFRPGTIGGTCAAMLLAVGVYLVYRGYVRGYVLVLMLAAAWCTAAVGPIWLVGPERAVRTVWTPLLAEGLDTGLLYCAAQMLSGDLLLAMLLVAVLAPMRPLTKGGQAVFALVCGFAVMAGQMYTTWGPIAFAVLLAVETLGGAIHLVKRRMA